MSHGEEILVQKAKHENDTMVVAQKIFALLQPGEIILLIGDLGMGKTFLARELLQLWGVEEPITSPTFNLIHNFEVENFHFIHADFYRINEEKELEDLDILEDLTRIRSDKMKLGIALIEWGERFPSIKKRATLEITLKPISNLDNGGRVIQVSRKKPSITT